MTTPALEYVVAEAAENGITDVLLVTNESKRAIAEYFRPNDDLEAALEKKDDQDSLELVRRAPALARIHEVDQDDPEGARSRGRAGRAVRRRRGHRRAAAGRLDRRPRRAARHDDRGLRRARWCRHRPDRRAARRDQQVRQRPAHRRQRAGRGGRRDRRARREAAGRDRAEHARDHRPVHPAAGDLRRAARDRSRARRARSS